MNRKELYMASKNERVLIYIGCTVVVTFAVKKFCQKKNIKINQVISDLLISEGTNLIFNALQS
jgi:hypothetical protein